MPPLAPPVRAQLGIPQFKLSPMHALPRLPPSVRSARYTNTGFQIIDLEAFFVLS